MPSVQKITPCLWFDRNAEEAANHYVSIFGNARIVTTSRYGDAGPLPKGSVLTVVFELEGQRFMGLNGGPLFKFSEAISMVVACDTQDEIDMFWEKLSAGGAKSRCGWLKDKFGVSWQVVPSMLDEIMGGGDAARSNRVMSAVLRMDKLDIATLRRAGESAAA
jgi:predicted 3-demethylubiquinone-9 3-methyltransferase (glyoxalase superfamily)